GARLRAGPGRPRPGARDAARFPAWLRPAAPLRRGREGRDDRRGSRRARSEPPARAGARGRPGRDPAPAEHGRARDARRAHGAVGLNGMELETAVRFGLPLTCVVGNDGGWGQIRNPQLSFYGEGRAVATSLPHTRFDLLAEALGGRGVLVREPAQIGGALARA